MIFDARHAPSTPRHSPAAAPRQDSCLSPQQVGALKKAFAGPKNRAAPKSIRRSHGTAVSPPKASRFPVF